MVPVRHDTLLRDSQLREILRLCRPPPLIRVRRPGDAFDAPSHPYKKVRGCVGGRLHRKPNTVVTQVTAKRGEAVHERDRADERE